MAIFTNEAYQIAYSYVDTSSFLGLLSVFTISVLVGIATYALTTILLKVEEAQFILKTYLKRKHLG